MPAAIPFIVAAATLASSGVSIYQAFSKPGGGPDPKAIQAQQQADAAKAKEAENQQKLQLLRRSAPDAQAQTGGALTDQGFASLVANIAGLPGDLNLAQELLKPGAGSSTGTTGGNSSFNITPTDSSIFTPGSTFGAGPQRGESGVSGMQIKDLQSAMDFLNGGQSSEHVSG